MALINRHHAYDFLCSNLMNNYRIINEFKNTFYGLKIHFMI